MSLSDTPLSPSHGSMGVVASPAGAGAAPATEEQGEAWSPANFMQQNHRASVDHSSGVETNFHAETWLLI